MASRRTSVATKRRHLIATDLTSVELSNSGGGTLALALMRWHTFSEQRFPYVLSLHLHTDRINCFVPG